ncbi:MAG: extensin family protein [Pelagibaca sp.]
MRVTSVLVCVWIMLAKAATAAPDTSLRPVARAIPTETTVLSLGDIRPVMRPELYEATLVRQLTRQFEQDADPGFQRALESQTDLGARTFAAVSPQATGLSIRPTLRPDNMVQRVMAQRNARARGAICGDPDIQGETVGFVPGRLSACGIQDAVRVRSVSGIPLSQEAMIDCPTAKALKTWVDKGMKPAIGTTGGGVAQIRVAAHYACRTRNNQPGARISEHGKGRAIDISGFRLRDGSEITLLQDWNRRETGAMLRVMQKRACGIFGTVLGPDSDRFHKDHFHFDTARHRGGAFCR